MGDRNPLAYNPIAYNPIAYNPIAYNHLARNLLLVIPCSLLTLPLTSPPSYDFTTLVLGWFVTIRWADGPAVG